MSRVSIWAPHPDDEIIGCWSVLSRKHLSADLEVVYFSGHDDPGIDRTRARFGFSTENVRFGPFHNSFQLYYQTVLAPDPAIDFHPLHQHVGQLAQQGFRDGRIERLILYTTRMNIPYVHEVSDPEAKRRALDECYPEKRSLWEHDHRFWLFEGHCEWHRPGQF